MKSSQVRRALPTDLPKLEALKLAVGYPGSLLYDEESYYQIALQRLRECVPRLRDLPECRLLVLVQDEEPQGYLLFVVDHEHGVTHQLQAVILDHAVFSFEALLTLITRARKTVVAFENQYLVTDLLATDRRQQLWFYRCGFRPEQNRAAKRIAPGYQGESSPDFRFRAAELDDLPFVLGLHSANSHVYLPAGRDTDLEAIELAYQLTYLGLDLSGKKDGSLYLIFEEVSSGEPAGYIFIRPGHIFGAVPSYYVYDTALSPKFGGRSLSRYLIGVAETLAGKEPEGAIVYGDGSLGAPAIASWHTQLGYTVDTIGFALDFRTRSLVATC